MTPHAAKPSSRPSDAWAPYRATVEDALGSCAHYLGRLQRSLAGTIAPDRRYFQAKSYQLLVAARRLVRTGQDIARWQHSRSALDSTVDPASECSLPAGHRGRHQSEPPMLIGERTCTDARNLANRCDAVADGLGWVTVDVDRLVATGAPLHDVEERLSGPSDEVEGIARGAERLQAGIDRLTTSY